MKVICSRNDCAGCGLCASSCPQKCIVMKDVDKLGHLFPVIDETCCTDCGKCRKVCPSINNTHGEMPFTAYAAWAKDVIDYKSSSSGGVATVMARYVIQKGGVVYGCAMLPRMDVKHIRVDNEEDLILLKGSKYVQSDIRDSFSQIKEDVNCGYSVLFFGTPCQVAAVKSMFSSQPNNLFLVDLICHGVPSVRLLRKHINKILPFEDCYSVIFREGNDYCLKVITFEDEHPISVYDSKLASERYKDFYINSFIDGYTYRNSCYRCKYACLKRVGDVCIGDFWGLGKSVSADGIPNHKDGCSLIMPVSVKGQELVEAIKPSLNIFERPVNEAVEGNNQLRAPVRKRLRIRLYRALAMYLDSSWPYYFAIIGLRLKLRLKKRK